MGSAIARAAPNKGTQVFTSRVNMFARAFSGRPQVVLIIQSPVAPLFITLRSFVSATVFVCRVRVSSIRAAL